MGLSHAERNSRVSVQMNAFLQPYVVFPGLILGAALLQKYVSEWGGLDRGHPRGLGLAHSLIPPGFALTSAVVLFLQRESAMAYFAVGIPCMIAWQTYVAWKQISAGRKVSQRPADGVARKNLAILFLWVTNVAIFLSLPLILR